MRITILFLSNNTNFKTSLKKNKIMNWIKIIEGQIMPIGACVICNLYKRYDVAYYDNYCKCWIGNGKAIQEGSKGVDITYYCEILPPKD